VARLTILRAAVMVYVWACRSEANTLKGKTKTRREKQREVEYFQGLADEYTPSHAYDTYQRLPKEKPNLRMLV
jgi:hypothetical protein